MKDYGEAPYRSNPFPLIEHADAEVVVLDGTVQKILIAAVDPRKKANSAIWLFLL